MTNEEQIKKLVGPLCLEKDANVISSTLQKINALLLRSKIVVGETEIEPLFVEAYFKNEFYYDDAIHSAKSKKSLQSNRQLRLYFHTRGYGGFDLVLSDDDRFDYSILIKASRIGKEVLGQIAGKNRVLEISGKDELVSLIDNPDVLEEDILFLENRVGVEKDEGKHRFFGAARTDVISQKRKSQLSSYLYKKILE